MNTIKFRGKRIDNGEWVIGCLVYGWEAGANHFTIMAQSVEQKKTGEFHSHLVNHASIGQFICRSDETDKEIYSGDIIQNGMSGTWLVQPLEQGSFSLLGISIPYKDKQFDISALNQHARILGNATDNPELLK